MESKEAVEITLDGVESGVNIYRTNCCPIIYNLTPPACTREEIPGLPCAFYLHNVLTPEECQGYIDMTEKMGFELAKITTSYGMVDATGVRNNKRVMWQTSEDIWMPIWQRICGLVPPTVEIWRSKWTAYGLNERFRFYRYHKGEEFKPHFDGSFPRSHTDESFLTFIIYLNDDFEGGKTTFFARKRQTSNVSVTPIQGSALVFWHGQHPESPLHEGSLCLSGSKYVLRSDVMYKQ